MLVLPESNIIKIRDTMISDINQALINYHSMSNTCYLCDSIMIIVDTIKLYKNIIQNDAVEECYNLFELLRYKCNELYCNVINGDHCACTCGFFYNYYDINKEILGSTYMINELFKCIYDFNQDCHILCKCLHCSFNKRLQF